MERRTATVPIWSVIVLIVGIFASVVVTIANAATSTTDIRYTSLERRTEQTEVTVKENCVDIVDLKVLLAEVVANQKTVIKILDKMGVK
jgi:hypothetical protein